MVSSALHEELWLTIRPLAEASEDEYSPEELARPTRERIRDRPTPATVRGLVDSMLSSLRKEYSAGSFGSSAGAAKAGFISGAHKATGELMASVLDSRSVRDTIEREVMKKINTGAQAFLDFTLSVPKRAAQRLLKIGVQFGRLATMIKAGYPHAREDVRDVEAQVDSGKIGELEGRRRLLDILRSARRGPPTMQREIHYISRGQ